MKGIIIYKGKYGATKQYAEWLGKELDLPVFNPDNYRTEDVFNCDYVIIGSSVYIGKLQMKDWIKSNIPGLLKKKLYMFVVSGTPPEERGKLETYLQGSVPFQMRKRSQVYFLPGKLTYSNLSWRDKFMLRMGAMLNKDKEAGKKMLTNYNNVRKENLDALINDVKNYTGGELSPIVPATRKATTPQYH
jgi:menaquinone-dependent protoporphyrinogen IX oxidase